MPPPKPRPLPVPNQSLDDADLMFLMAMGGVAVPSEPSISSLSASPSPPMPPPPTAPDVAFNAALGELKGLRALPSNPLLKDDLAPPNPAPRSGSPPPPDLGKAPEARASTSDAPETLQGDGPQISPPHQAPEPPRVKPGPMLIHLAAGMAIEVDGTMDLRRHSLNDARERLKEGVKDASAMQWRTLLLTFGPNEALKQGFLAFLTTPQAQQSISRYAQAPIPMGGDQAWIIYLNPPPRDASEEP